MRGLKNKRDNGKAWAGLGFCRGKKCFLPGQWKKTTVKTGKNWQ